MGATFDVQNMKRPAQLAQTGGVEIGDDDHFLDRWGAKKRKNTILGGERKEEFGTAAVNVVVDL